MVRTCLTERQHTKLEQYHEMATKKEDTMIDTKKTLDRWHKTRPREIGNCTLGRIGPRPWKFESNIDSGDENSCRVMKS